MTRVARLDEDMWTELFLDDADYLTTELDELIVHLREYGRRHPAPGTPRPCAPCCGTAGKRRPPLAGTDLGFVILHYIKE